MKEQIDELKKQIEALEVAKSSGLYFANALEVAKATGLSLASIVNNRNIPKPTKIGGVRLYLKSNFKKWTDKNDK